MLAAPARHMWPRSAHYRSPPIFSPLLLRPAVGRTMHAEEGEGREMMMHELSSTGYAGPDFSTV